MNEKELSDLLDSVTEDFSKLQRPNESNEQKEQTEPKKLEADSKAQDSFPPLFNADPDFKETWSKLMKSCADPIDENDATFHENLQKTLKSISEKAKDISGNENVMDEDELAKMFLNLSEEGGDESKKDGPGDMDSILPLMNSIMENLLSKDFLYPTLCDLSSKYPNYLKQNKSKISAEDYERYEKQLTVLNEICAEFEKEVDTESEKSARFQKVMNLMQTMQSYGTPPTDLVGDNSNQSDVLNQFNQLNQDNTGCCLM